MSNTVQHKIRLFYLDKGITLKDRNRLKLFLLTLFQREGRKLESLNYIFCSDKYLLKINRDYLRHDYYTDIVTFDLSPAAAVVGEIYVSLDRVRDNAASLASSLKVELHRVMFHGALHLCGYEDKSAKGQATMREREDYYLGRYFKK